MIVDDFYEGRWTIEGYDDEVLMSGFDTYKHGDFDGPSERVRQGEVIQRGDFVAGIQHGDWKMPWGEGVTCKASERALDFEGGGRRRPDRGLCR